ncbi:hypothetical protein [Sphingobacterium detergens]|uniref:hypothetical protein n=1 Tax=Sphingobacterium detergens TaxID=1145106 RepID=UPI003AAC2D51
MYVLCSQGVVDAFPDLVRSTPFKSGYEFDKNNEYYIVEIESFDPIEVEFVKRVAGEDTKVDSDFWAYEICDSLVSLEPVDPIETEEGEEHFIPEEITLEDCRSLGLFAAIEQFLSLSTEQNRAFALYKLAEKYQCSAIELVNQLT